MTNKLLEILDEFDNLSICFNYGERAIVRKFLSEKLVEYARSKVPTDGENPYFTHDIEYTKLLEVFNIIDNSIQQDVQSLNN